MPLPVDQVVRLTNGIVEVDITTACGPRVVRFARTGGRNLFALTPQLSTPTPLGPWFPIGGHRLWVAPERMPGSYAPDDRPPAVASDGPLRASVAAPTDAAGMRKTMRVALEPKRARVVVVHEITNDTCWPLRVAPWAITIVDQAGTAVLPQPPFRAHADSFLPARPLVQWAYTDLSDPRWHIGRRLVSLTPDAGRPDPQKIGAANHAGWCAVVYPDLTFVKQAPWIDSVEYPDMGCSTELFTAGDYLEVETLAPLSWLEPGETATHTETWTIAAGIDSDLRDAPLEAAIAAAIDADATP